MSLEPAEKILVVSSEGTSWLLSDSISNGKVGQKAFGLSCVPAAWTLPFLVVSSELLDEFRGANSSQRDTLIETWSRRISAGISKVGIPPDSPILVRSSAVSESLEDRGRFHSAAGTLKDLPSTLSACLQKLASDADLGASKIHLVVQREVRPLSGKGHLSNERHCYEEARDWLGQFERHGQSSDTFSVNLRNWRSRGSTASENLPLLCNLETGVSKVLHIPAWWGYRQGTRLHIEWVWDGARIYIVQADEATKLAGVDPTADPNFSKRISPETPIKVLAKINEKHAKKYHKIGNVYNYLKLRLPITDLYVLDDPKVLESISRGKPPRQLVADLETLSKASLVIRTDLATQDKSKLQLLPRTNEVRDADAALEFLKSTLDELRRNGITEEVAFIFHNFIPALASAFAYAAPGQRKVWIEALWGLPEGLYYNAHDKVEVDTLVRSASNLTSRRAKQFAITKRARFKRYFVAPDSSGAWVVKPVAEPFDWRLSIPRDEWIRQIAMDSRRIAEKDGRSVSIMWFIGVPTWASPSPVFPWYHEAFDLTQVGKPQAPRRKTPFDQSYLVRTREDVEKLRREASSGDTRIRQIRIQPSEEPLLRDKYLLKDIGELAKQMDAVILLEGSTLSHAYYQLTQTKAMVEVVHPFDAPEDKREFNKVVRDDIPSRISQGGESVRVSKLTGEYLLKALREKLVEEAFEALDATSRDSIVEELADVEEVIAAVLKQLKVTHRELARRGKAKRRKAGGFDRGYVLVNTNNPPPARSPKDQGTSSLMESGMQAGEASVEHTAAHAKTSIRKRWGDKREHRSGREHLLKLVVTAVSNGWSAESAEIPYEKDTIRARVEGKRVGADLHLEISIYVPPQQLKLLD